MASCSISGCVDERQTSSRGANSGLVALDEVTSPLALDSCQDSASNSTATPSEVASAQGETSPRHGEAMSGVLKKLARPEIDDAPLAEMFADSDDELRLISPSKSARRRMRRQRQRDALRVALCQNRQVEEQQTFEENSGRSQEVQEQPSVIIVKHVDPDERARGSNIVTLDKLGFELGTGAGETSQAFLLATPAHSGPRTPGVLSTNPCSESPSSVASPCMFRASPFSDASSRLMPPMTPQPQAGCQQFWSASPCASSRAGGFSVSAFAAEVSVATVTSNGTTNLFAPGSIATSPCSPSLDATVMAPSTPRVARVEAWMPSPAGQSAANTLQVLFGSGANPAGDVIVATLQAAVPEVYED